MSMKLTPDDMLSISEKVKGLDRLGIAVRVINVEGHDIYLRQDGDGNHLIVGITDKPKDHHEGNLR